MKGQFIALPIALAVCVPAARAQSRTFLGDDQRCPANHAESLVGILEGQEASFQRGLAIPERDKLQMKIHSRRNVSFSWTQAERIAKHIRIMDRLGDGRREQYSTLILLAAASGLRSSELLALKIDDIDFKASTIRVEESSDQRNNARIGPSKNAAAYRTVALHDLEGKKAMRKLKHLLVGRPHAETLVFRSKRGGPLLETTILNQGLYLALKALDLPQEGLHGFRRGCNRRWELAGVNPAHPATNGT